jgi:hypothetical protein
VEGPPERIADAIPFFGSNSTKDRGGELEESSRYRIGIEMKNNSVRWTGADAD